MNKMIISTNQGTTVVEINRANFDLFSISEPSSSLHYHFVLSANTEIGSLTDADCKKFYRFIASCTQILNGSVETIGGKDDTVHLLVTLNLTQNPADFIRRLKLFTSSWAQRNLNLANFAWDEEEVFTVSGSQCNYLSQSIQRQSKIFYRRKAALSH